MSEKSREYAPDLLAGAAAGFLGGIVASFLMEQFQAAYSSAASRIHGQKKEASTPATVKAADAIAQKVIGHEVPPARKELAGEAVHYAMGGISGAIYGTVNEILPMANVGEGTAFGSTVFFLADEVSVPLLGLSQGPNKIPIGTHLYAFTSHLVYGWVTELVRRAARGAMG